VARQHEEGQIFGFELRATETCVQKCQPASSKPSEVAIPTHNQGRLFVRQQNIHGVQEQSDLLEVFLCQQRPEGTCVKFCQGHKGQVSC